MVTRQNYWYLLWLSSFSFINGINLYLIGDSFDRYWVHEWCEDKRSTYHNYVEKSNYVFPYVIVWGDQILDPGHHNSPLFCRDNELNDTVAQIQIYGSNMTGPYHDGYDGPTKNTENRVKLGLQGYFDLLDTLPDRVLIHTTQWDVAYLSMIHKGKDFGADSQLFKDALLLEERRTNELIDYVQTIIDSELKRRQKLQSANLRRRLRQTVQHHEQSSHNTHSHNKTTKSSAINSTNLININDSTRYLHEVGTTHTATDLTKPDSEWYSDREKQRMRNEYNKAHNIIDTDYYTFKVEIGLRTTTRRIENPTLITAFNQIITKISQKHNLTLYDVDSDLWGSVNFQQTPNYNKLLFRDEVHPIHDFSTKIVNKMLQRQFTPFFTQQGGAVQTSHIITDTTQINSDVYKHMNFQLIRAIATDVTNTNQQAIDNSKNKQITQANTTNSITTTTQSIPGYGPIYYSMFVNGTRMKWLISDVSATFYAQLVHQKKVEHNSKHSKIDHHKHFNHTTDKIITNTQYEQKIRPVLEHLLLSVSDLVLLSTPLLDNIQTQGVMPVLFDLTARTAFTVQNSVNSSVFDLYLVEKNHDVHQITQNIIPAFMQLCTMQRITIQHNIEALWLDTFHVSHDVIPNIFHDNALIRFHSDKSVFVVLNFTRHAFTGLASFVSRGYDFGDVIAYEKSVVFWVELMPIGEPLI